MSITDNMTKEERKEYWELVMEEYANSDLSKKDFCDANDINLSTFNYWENRLEELNKLNEEGRFVELDIPNDNSKAISLHSRDEVDFIPELGIEYAGLRILINKDTPMPLLNTVLSEVGYA